MIDSEKERLDQATALNMVSTNPLGEFLITALEVSPAKVLTAVREAKSWEDWVEQVRKVVVKRNKPTWTMNLERATSAILTHVNQMRIALGLSPFEGPEGPTQ